MVGMKHRGTEALVASLPQGEPLTLIREPDNKFDPNAVQVWAQTADGPVHIGYVRASQVRPLAMAMDALAPPLGKLILLAKLAIDGGRWPLVELEM